MGRSVENREIKGIVINYNPGRNNTFIGMIEGTLHAREWIVPATATWIIKEFLTSSDPEVRALAQNIEWHIFPVVNPDGYEYTFTTHRMWRKNRSTRNFTSCAATGVDDDMSNGVDLNRNFDYVWMKIGASDNPCTNTFAGPSAFSEPESRAVADYVLALKNQGTLIYYFGLHSFTQLIVIPYSHMTVAESAVATNYADMFEIAIRGATKLKERFGTEYRVGVSADIMYPMSGTSFDWVKYATNVPVSFLIEFRDLGEYGFLLPPEQIIPNNLEVMDALLEIDRAYKSYENYKVYDVVPKNDAQVQILHDLKKEGYDYWTDVFTVNSNVRIMVKPEKQNEFVNYLEKVGLNPSVSISNVKKLIEDQLKPSIVGSDRSSTLGSLTWTRYHTLSEIHAWLDELVELYPGVVHTVNIGASNEGRPIKGVIIDFKRGDRGQLPLVAMIEGGIHAREWISPATVTWIIKEFLSSNNQEDRMWRKNRNEAHYVNCTSVDNDLSNGIDLNRNFNFLWMTIGASSNPCTQTFAGPSPGSEPETQAISKYVLSLKESGNVIYYFAFHSFSQMILVPYSHVSGADVLQVENYADLFEIAIRGADKLTERHGTPYLVGTSAEILYEVSGSSFDWVKGVAKIPIVYLFELRDVGEYGFLLPTEQIIPNNEEIMDCLLEMDKTTRLLGYYYSGTVTITSSFVTLLLGIVFLFLS
ncbi:unnamed protein product, partial [Iphiclides podalirius]